MKAVQLPSIAALPGKKQELAKKILAYPYWRHRIDLGNGFFTPGYITDRSWKIAKIRENELPEKSFVDIGANDGLIAFLAESKGAKHVDAIDLYSDDRTAPSNRSGLGKEGIHLAKEYLESQINIKTADLLGLKGEAWDFVHVSNVLAWLQKPFDAFDVLSSITKDTLYLRDSFLHPRTNKEYELHPEIGTTLMNVDLVKRELQKAGFKEIQKIKVPEHKKLSEIHFPLVRVPKGTKIFSDPERTDVVEKIEKGFATSLTGILENSAYLRKKGWIPVQDLEFLEENRPLPMRLIKSIMGKRFLMRIKNSLKEWGSPSGHYVLIAKK